MRAGADYHISTTNDACASIVKLNLERFRTDKAGGSHKKLRAASLEFIEVHVDQTIDHFPLAIAHCRHVDLEIVFRDSELFASLKERGDLGTMDNVFARQACNV